MRGGGACSVRLRLGLGLRLEDGSTRVSVRGLSVRGLGDAWNGIALMIPSQACMSYMVATPNSNCTVIPALCYRQ